MKFQTYTKKRPAFASLNFIRAIFALSLFFAFPTNAFYCQILPKQDKFIKILNKTDIPAEKSIAVNPKVEIQFCVADGNLKINGWNRSEVRVFIDKGSEIDFKIREKEEKTEEPVRLEVIGYAAGKKLPANPEKCLSGEKIEIDVPRQASVSVKGRIDSAAINFIRKVSLHFVSGDASVSHISDGIEAVIYDGDITVGNSRGAISLAGTSGNIVAYDVLPKETGDVFKAKTSSGIITLQKIGHGQTQVNAISGSIRFTGDILNRGQYNFGTQSGLILISVPPDSSGKISASYGYGAFSSEIPMTNVVKSKAASIKSLIGTIGKGDANLNLTTFNGQIYIKKQ